MNFSPLMVKISYVRFNAGIFGGAGRGGGLLAGLDLVSRIFPFHDSFFVSPSPHHHFGNNFSTDSSHIFFMF